MNTNRYSRHILLSKIGMEGQLKLQNARVLVVGAGGLGCPVLQYLVAAGIGRLGIVDFDVVDESNLQRQVLFGMSSIGINKAIAAKSRLIDLNPEVDIEVYPEKLTVKNALSLFRAYDIIVDGTDNFATRYLINDACVISNKPLVYGAIFKFEGQVTILNYQGGPTYRCLFPVPPKQGSIPSCAEVGVLGVLPGIIGSMMANEVLKIVLNIGEVLTGELLMYDALSAKQSKFKFEKDSSQISKVLSFQDDFERMDYDLICGIQPIQEIEVSDALQLENVQFVDVREANEMPKISAIDILSIPLGQLEKRLSELESGKNIIVLCQSGMRSKQAVQLLAQSGVNNCMSLIGGVIKLNEFTKDISIL